MGASDIGHGVDEGIRQFCVLRGFLLDQSNYLEYGHVVCVYITALIDDGEII